MQLALEDLESLGSTANRQLTELGQKNRSKESILLLNAKIFFFN